MAKKIINKNVIYKITNVVTDMLYIGSAVSLSNRKKSHLSLLRRQIHENPYLQNAWDKYGEKSFEFQVIDQVPFAEELEFRERYWFDKYDFDTELYNIAEDTFAPMLGRNHTEETKAKMSEAKSGENNYWFGKTFSNEHLENISKSKSGENHPMWGKILPKETREKISAANRKFPKRNTLMKVKPTKALKKPTVQIDPQNNNIIAEYESISEAARAIGVSASHISAVCNQTEYYRKDRKKWSTRKSAGGYKWMFVSDLDNTEK